MSEHQDVTGAPEPGRPRHRAEPAFVDGHVHFWDPGRLEYRWLAGDPVLGRPFLPADLAAAGPAPEGIVFVQADCAAEQSLAEVHWVQQLRREGAPVLGIVAQAALERGPGCAGQLARLADEPLVIGVRRLIQDEPAGFATAPDFVAGVRMLADHRLTMDLCIRQHQLGEVTELVEQVPEVSFVLDHLGKPAVDGGGPAGSLRSWADRLGRLGARPNVSCKLSGLTTEAGPAHRTPEHLRPYLRAAIEAFGPQRCMFGSDWPVMTLATGYGPWLELVTDAISDLSPGEREQVLRGTARAVYGGNRPDRWEGPC